MRTGAATQIGLSETTGNDFLQYPNYAVQLTQTLSSSVVIAFKATNGVAVANEVVIYSMRVEFLPESA